MLGYPPLNKNKKRPNGKKSKSPKQTRLSKTEKALLARFQKSTDVFEKYKRTVKELAAAQAAVEMAQEALHDIPRDHITTIADVDPEAAELFRTLGLFDESPEPDQLTAAPSIPMRGPQGDWVQDH